MKARTTIHRRTDLSALLSDIKKLGPEGALPNKLPQKWLLSIARDVVMSRYLEQAHPDDVSCTEDCLAPIISMIVIILESQNSPIGPIKKPPELSFEESDINEYVAIYEFLVLEELAARTTGVQAGSYSLKSIFQPEPKAF